MTTSSIVRAWKILWTEEPGALQSMGVTKSQMRLSMHTHRHFYSHFRDIKNREGKKFLRCKLTVTESQRRLDPMQQH